MGKKQLYTRDNDAPISAEDTFTVLGDVLKRSLANTDKDKIRKELKELEDEMKNSPQGILPEDKRKRKAYLEDALIKAYAKEQDIAKAKKQAEEVQKKAEQSVAEQKEHPVQRGQVFPFAYDYDFKHYQIDQNAINTPEQFHDPKNFSNILDENGEYKKEYKNWVNGMTAEKFEEYKKRLAEIANVSGGGLSGFKPEIDELLSWDVNRWKERSLDKNFEHTHTINNALYSSKPLQSIGIKSKPIDTKINRPGNPPDKDTPDDPPSKRKIGPPDLLPLLALLRDKPDYRLGSDLRRNSALLSERSSPKVYTRFNPIYSDYSAVAENTPKVMAAAAHRDDSTSATTGMRLARALVNAGIKERMAVDAQNIAQRNHMAAVQTDVDKFNANQVAHDNARNQQVDMARLQQANLAAQADDVARTLASQANSNRINSLIDMLDKRRKEREMQEQIDRAKKDGVLHHNFYYLPQQEEQQQDNNKTTT